MPQLVEGPHHPGAEGSVIDESRPKVRGLAQSRLDLSRLRQACKGLIVRRAIVPPHIEQVACHGIGRCLLHLQLAEIVRQVFQRARRWAAVETGIRVAEYGFRRNAAVDAVPVLLLIVPDQGKTGRQICRTRHRPEQLPGGRRRVGGGIGELAAPLGNELPIPGIIRTPIGIAAGASLRAHGLELAGERVGRVDQACDRAAIGFDALAQVDTIRAQLFGQRNQGTQRCGDIGVP